MPAEARPVFAVTGAGGAVGGAIAGFLEARGFTVLRLSRSAGYFLERPTPRSLLARGSADVLVHCAYDFSVSSWEDIRRVNVEGSLRLLDAADRGGVGRTIFISSLAAYDGCASLYGRGKRLVEEAVLKRGGHVVRPGTVFGPSPGGMMGALSARVMAGRWMPVIRHPGALYLAHEEDLSALVLSLASGGPPPENVPWLAAGPRAWTLEGLLMEMARRMGRPLRLTPVPWRLAWGGLKVLEWAGRKPSFRSDSVLSLARPVPPEALARLRPPPIPFRDY